MPSRRGAGPSTTVGYERRFAWWSHFLLTDDLQGFTDELLSGQPDVPSYFGRMKRQNKAGPALVPKGPLVRLEPADLEGHLLIDTRSREAYQRGFVPNSLSLTAGKTFETWAGWLIDPDTERPLALLAANEAEAQGLRERLWRVGIDNVAGYVTGFGDLPTRTAYPLEPAAFDALKGKFVLDVRTQAEYLEGHIPDATLVPAGRLPRHLSDLPRDRPIVVHCQSGARSPGAASLLRAHGFNNVAELAGGYPNWLRARTPESAR